MVDTSGRYRVWLRMSVAIAGLGLGATVVGLVAEESVYGTETPNWAAQAVGQDIANLVAFPTMLVLAFAAWRGSLRAYIAWIGTVVYSAYSYAIYAFDISFGPLFLVWVAILGLSVYTLIGAIASIDPRRVKASFAEGAPARWPAIVLVVIASAFTLLWLAEIVPATFSGDPPEALVEVGLPTNPVHVLDLALFLPAAFVGGVALARRRPLGYVLAPAVLVAMILLSLGIIALTLVLVARGLEDTPGVAIVIGALTIVEVAAALAMLRGMEKNNVAAVERER